MYHQIDFLFIQCFYGCFGCIFHNSFNSLLNVSDVSLDWFLVHLILFWIFLMYFPASLHAMLFLMSMMYPYIVFFPSNTFLEVFDIFQNYIQCFPKCLWWMFMMFVRVTFNAFLNVFDDCFLFSIKVVIVFLDVSDVFPSEVIFNAFPNISDLSSDSVHSTSNVFLNVFDVFSRMWFVFASNTFLDVPYIFIEYITLILSFVRYSLIYMINLRK